MIYRINLFRPKGRLGNSIFQLGYCCGYAGYARHNFVLWSNSWYKRQGKKSPDYLLIGKYCYRLDHFVDLTISVILFFLSFCRSEGIDLELKIKIWHFLEIRILDGYFQKWEALDTPVSTNIRSSIDSVRSEGTRFSRQVRHGDSKRNICAVHVRRGDYCNKENSLIYKRLDTDYYQQAQDLVLSMCENICFCWVSQEPSDCQSSLMHPDAEHIIMSSMTEVDTLGFFIDSDYLITANSTFSVAAALLRSDPTSRVIYPREWFNNNERNRAHISMIYRPYSIIL